MLLRALYDLASERQLFDSVHLQNRPLHMLIPIGSEGVLEGKGVIPLYSKDAKGKERLGQERPMPRFPGENNGGKAYFLAESCSAIFGLDKETGEGHLRQTGRQDNATKSFLHFWEQIRLAHERTSLPSLGALLKFRDRYLYDDRDRLRHRLPFIETRQSKTGKAEVGAVTSGGGWERLGKATLAFRVAGDLVFDANPDAPLTQYWKETYRKLAFSETDEEQDGGTKPTTGLCLITGQLNVPIARSHNPKILRIPNIGVGGRLVSFAQECPAFSSYGFEMGENAPVSEEAAPSYLLALQSLLDSDTHSLRVRPAVVCFWAKKQDQAANFIARMMRKPDPLVVSEFLKSPWAGLERSAAHLDQFYSVALSANAKRVVVRHWMQTTVQTAIERLHNWFADLAVVAFGRESGAQVTRRREAGAPAAQKEEPPPLSINCLANTTVRDPGDLSSDAASQLYRAALERTRPPIVLVKRVLDRLTADLAKYGLGVLETPIPSKTLQAIRKAGQPVPPPGVTRFALLKLILNRNGKENDPVTKTELFETEDAAYNCGRLLSVFNSLQRSAHDGKLEGATIAERYFGSASSSPSAAFSILWRLHQHHLKKVRQKGEKGQKAAYRIKESIMQICSRFAPQAAGQPPEFPRTLTLVEQGRFALGFYQQEAARAQAVKLWKQKLEATGQSLSEEDVPEEDLFTNKQD